MAVPKITKDWMDHTILVNQPALKTKHAATPTTSVIAEDPSASSTNGGDGGGNPSPEPMETREGLHRFVPSWWRYNSISCSFVLLEHRGCTTMSVGLSIHSMVLVLSSNLAPRYMVLEYSIT